MPETTGFWGAYRIEPKPLDTDILHIFAANSLIIETDLGEQIEMTLEDGRRNLFSGKDSMLLQDWALAQQPIPCELPDTSDASLINTGVSLSTDIPPDGVQRPQPILSTLTGPAASKFTLSGSTETAGTIVIERVTDLEAPMAWQALLTNDVAAGSFTVQIPVDTTATAGFVRVRMP